MPNQHKPADRGQERKPALRRDDVVVDPSMLVLLDRIIWLKESRRRRPALRFGLRTLLISVTLLSLILAFIVGPLLRHKKVHAREMDIVSRLRTLPFTLHVESTEVSSWRPRSARLVGAEEEIFERVYSITLEENFRFVLQPDGSKKRLPAPRNLPAGVFDRLTELEHLEEISLANCILTPPDLEVLARCHLRYLELSFCHVDGEPLEPPPQFRQLRSLSLTYCEPHAGTLLETIGDCPELTRISIMGCALTEGDFELLARIRSLEELRLSNTPVTEHGLKSLSRLPNLRKLTLEEAETGPAGPFIVATFPALEFVNMSGEFVTPEAASALVNSPKLTKVHLSGSAVDREALGILREAGLSSR